MAGLPEQYPKTILTLSAEPKLDRRSARCRPDDFPPYPPKLSAYRDCAGFGRFLVVSATVLAIFLGGISSVSAADPSPSSSPSPTHFCDACNLITPRPQPSVIGRTLTPQIVLPATDTQ